MNKPSSTDNNLSSLLVKFAHMTRNLKGNGLDEGASTRLLVHCAKLIVSGVNPNTACRCSISEAITADPEMLKAVNELSSSLFSGRIRFPKAMAFKRKKNGIIYILDFNMSA